MSETERYGVHFSNHKLTMRARRVRANTIVEEIVAEQNKGASSGVLEIPDITTTGAAEIKLAESRDEAATTASFVHNALPDFGVVAFTERETEDAANRASILWAINPKILSAVAEGALQGADIIYDSRAF